MKSKASIKGHPVHSILVTFPIAFFTATLFFDIAGLHNTISWTIGSRLELLGIIVALAAAIPGIIDYLYTIPPESSAKKRGTTHGILNLSMTALFAISFIYRQHDDANMYIIIALEACGFILMCIAGWMGGTLVFRNMIGVYNRYADAGKWNEIYLNTNDKLIEVALINELKINQLKLIHINNKRIVVGNTENGYIAFDDRCTHKGGSLAGGTMICGTIQCPWHGSQFDTKTGRVKAGPAKAPINCYPVIERDGKVFLQL